MGDFLTSATGTKNDFQADNPYTNDQTTQLYNQQQQLSNLLMQQAQGGGPNPAQQQYLQNAQTIAQQQASTYAANRALNPGLAARMAGNTAANVGQQAAGNAAIQQAQQQLASQGQLANLNQSQQGLVNQSRLGAQQINAGVAAGNQQMAGKMVGGIMSGAGAMMGLAHGGMVPHYAEGGAVGPMSIAGKFFSGMGSNIAATPNQATGQPIDPLQQGFAQLGKGVRTQIQNHQVQPLQTTTIAPMLPATGGAPVMVAKQGGVVPGKAAVAGDSFKNDTVPAMVSPGEIVLPRHITQAKDAPDQAKKFVEAILARENLRKKK